MVLCKNVIFYADGNMRKNCPYGGASKNARKYRDVSKICIIYPCRDANKK